MKKYDCSVIVCGPAVGKTYLASIDNRFVDIDGMKADYKYGISNLSLYEKEKGKLNRGKVINNDSTMYAINLLKETIGDNKIALLSYSEKILNYLIENNIKYCLVYADIDSVDEYEERMRKRGNNDIFIKEMTNIENWNSFYEENKNDNKPTYKIKLKKGEYLSDIKDMF